MARSVRLTIRFEIFKRDEFTCQYCGRTPPATVLEIDHVIAVTNGGTNDPNNLITACFDCNRGKGARELGHALPFDAAERAELIREREEQIREYDAILREQREREDYDIDEIIAIYEDVFTGWSLRTSTRPSIRNFLQRLPKTEVIDAMEIACSRVNEDRAFRYFCGVCWRKITVREG